jgi:hypothetical protein
VSIEWAELMGSIDNQLKVSIIETNAVLAISRYPVPSSINLWSGISTIDRRIAEGSIKNCKLIFHGDIGGSCRKILVSLLLD